MGVLAALTQAGPAASAGGSAPTCSRFWNPGPVLRRGRAIRGWQDLRAVHGLRASDGENAPWWQDARAVYSPTALCGAFWMHSTHILPKLTVFEYMQAICCREPVFSRPGPLRERIGAVSCHGRQLGNASGHNLAMAGSLGCIRAISCHGQAPDDRHRSSSTAYLRL